MSPLNPETWHMHPLALHLATTPAAWLAVIVGVVVVWAVVSWRTDWRWRPGNKLRHSGRKPKAQIQVRRRIRRIRHGWLWRTMAVLGGTLLAFQGVAALAGWPAPFTQTLKNIPGSPGISWRNVIGGVVCILAGATAAYSGLRRRRESN